MPLLLPIAGWLALGAWLYLLLARGAFWRIRQSRPPAPSPPAAARRVAAIVPARNEAEFIAPSLRSLLEQQFAGALRVYLVDDGSADSTAALALQTAATLGKTESLTVISGPPPPAGWTGKLWALQQGLERAGDFAPDFFLFTDADVEHAPAALATLISLAERNQFDLVSLLVKLRCRTPAEKLLIPAFVFFFFKLYPPRWIQNPGRSAAGAAGGCMLVRPQALALSGGLAAIRGQIIDDCALARSLKRSGARIWLGAAERSQSLRGYGAARAIAAMIARTAFSQLRHSLALLALTLAGMALLYLLPLALVFTGHRRLLALGAGSLALMLFAYLPVIRFYCLNPLWALTLPLAALFYAGATLRSAWNFWRGRGGEWKGRIQDARGAAAP